MRSLSLRQFALLLVSKVWPIGMILFYMSQDWQSASAIQRQPEGNLQSVMIGVKGRLERLEPCALKGARPVLRGGGAGNGASLRDRLR